MKLYTAKGSGGGQLVEIVLELASARYEVEYIDWDKLRTHDELKKLNPLMQVPVLVLDDGSVMTESLAIGLYLNQKFSLKLAPIDNPTFLRWATFIVASIYPTFTFGDSPALWISDESSRKELKTNTDEARMKMWMQMEEVISGKYFLGNELSLIDIYFFTFYKSRPGGEWFRNHCPKIYLIGNELSNNSVIQKIIIKNS